MAAAYLICQSLPEFTVDERGDAAGGFGRASVILTVVVVSIVPEGIIDLGGRYLACRLVSAFVSIQLHVVDCLIVPARNVAHSLRYSQGLVSLPSVSERPVFALVSIPEIP